MHDVCRIPLWQARQCAIVIIESEKAYHLDGWQSLEVATLLAQETGNILVAEATASLYIEAAKETAYEPLWREILEALHYGEVVDDEERSVAERRGSSLQELSRFQKNGQNSYGIHLANLRKVSAMA
jgi:hypothetical protein